MVLVLELVLVLVLMLVLRLVPELELASVLLLGPQLVEVLLQLMPIRLSTG